MGHLNKIDVENIKKVLNEQTNTNRSPGDILKSIEKVIPEQLISKSGQDNIVKQTSATATASGTSPHRRECHGCCRKGENCTWCECKVILISTTVALAGAVGLFFGLAYPRLQDGFDPTARPTVAPWEPRSWG